MSKSFRERDAITPLLLFGHNQGDRESYAYGPFRDTDGDGLWYLALCRWDRDALRYVAVEIQAMPLIGDPDLIERTTADFIYLCNEYLKTATGENPSIPDTDARAIAAKYHDAFAGYIYSNGQLVPKE